MADYNSSRKAFTMVELIFVIIVIGILATVAVPRLAATRDDAIVTKARAVASAVRSSVNTERQKRILRSDFNHPITNLNYGNSSAAFDKFNPDKDGNSASVLETPVYTCTTLGKTTGCWKVTAGPTYSFVLPDGSTVDFNLTRSRFTCKSSSGTNCRLFTN